MSSDAARQEEVDPGTGGDAARARSRPAPHLPPSPPLPTPAPRPPPPPPHQHPCNQSLFACRDQPGASGPTATHSRTERGNESWEWGLGVGLRRCRVGRGPGDEKGGGQGVVRDIGRGLWEGAGGVAPVAAAPGPQQGRAAAVKRLSTEHGCRVAWGRRGGRGERWRWRRPGGARKAGRGVGEGWAPRARDRCSEQRAGGRRAGTRPAAGGQAARRHQAGGRPPPYPPPARR